MVALCVLFALVHWAGGAGLKLLCILTVVFGTRELMRILFTHEDSRLIKVIFLLLMVAVFTMTSLSKNVSGLGFGLVVILFFSASLWLRLRFHDLMALSQFQAKSILGFFYLGLLPGFAWQIVDLRNGPMWFVAMLAFVLSGDSLAYFVGVRFGKTPLLPEISPKKSVEGALGGLLGSFMAGLAVIAYRSELPVGPVLTLAVLAGLTGQMGDLFESLLKRVANQKDSGTSIPGHGGILDRLDGVIFAAPVVLLGATLIERAGY